MREREREEEEEELELKLKVLAALFSGVIERRRDEQNARRIASRRLSGATEEVRYRTGKAAAATMVSISHHLEYAAAFFQ